MEVSEFVHEKRTSAERAEVRLAVDLRPGSGDVGRVIWVSYGRNGNLGRRGI